LVFFAVIFKAYTFSERFYTMKSVHSEHWEQLDQVHKFSNRPVDHHLQTLVDQYSEPENVRALDLGCAGGRNTVFLLQKGFKVWAVDKSSAMIAETQRRCLESWPPGRCEGIQGGDMIQLQSFESGFFDLIVALGVYHNAQSESEFYSALSESSRVLRPGGDLLVSVFLPGTAMGSPPKRRIPDGFLYDGFPSGSLFLPDLTVFDRAMRQSGFVISGHSEIVEKKEGSNRRITYNALYRKAQARRSNGNPAVLALRDRVDPKAFPERKL
jgi:SAM-dependent methyltransferase